jgi:membrane-associated phospholipid phosphatase
MTINTFTIDLMTSMEHPALTILSKTISIIFEPLVLLIISLLLSAFLYLKVSKIKATILASTVIITALAIRIIKEILQIPRPLNSLIIEHGFSFPSGHTTMTLVFFSILVYMFSKKKSIPTTYSIAGILIILTALSRLYLRVHFLTDIIGGLILGTIILATAILIIKKNRLL